MVTSWVLASGIVLASGGGNEASNGGTPYGTTTEPVSFAASALASIGDGSSTPPHATPTAAAPASIAARTARFWARGSWPGAVGAPQNGHATTPSLTCREHREQLESFIPTRLP